MDTLQSRVAGWTSGSAYNGADHRRKHLTHCAARAALRKLATSLELAPGSYDVRTNKGGIAVTGETTLHTDTLYVQIFGDWNGRGMRILFRQCKGRKDYSGGTNHYAPLSALTDGTLLAALRRLGGHSVPHELNGQYLGGI